MHFQHQLRTSNGAQKMNNQHHLLNPTSFFAWQQIKKIWTQKRNQDSCRASHKSLDEFMNAATDPASEEVAVDVNCVFKMINST